MSNTVIADKVVHQESRSIMITVEDLPVYDSVTYPKDWTDTDCQFLLLHSSNIEISSCKKRTGFQLAQGISSL